MLVFPNPANEPVDPEIPKKAESLKMPPDTSIMRGRQVYLQRCWMCHGDAGQGEGPAGQHLAPLPANFTEPELKKFPDSEWFWKVSYGIGNAAMPQWHLLLSEEDRWAAIKYLKAMFVNPSEPTDVSDDVPPAYQALDPAPSAPTPETMEKGKALYEELCTGCHGPKALGDGPYGAPLMPTPANLTEDPAVSAGIDFWYWRVDQGVVGTDPGAGGGGRAQGRAGSASDGDAGVDQHPRRAGEVGGRVLRPRARRRQGRTGRRSVMDLVRLPASSPPSRRSPSARPSRWPTRSPTASGSTCDRAALVVLDDDDPAPTAEKEVR